MYVDDLIKELESWKAPASEVTVNGCEITRVACSSSGKDIEIQVDSFLGGYEREDFESEIDDLNHEITSFGSRIEHYEYLFERFHGIFNSAKIYLNVYRRQLEENNCSDKRLDALLRDIEFAIDRSDPDGCF